jgi:hypothetical protein
VVSIIPTSSGTRTEAGRTNRSQALPLLAVIVWAAACGGASTPAARTATNPSATTAAAAAHRRDLAARYLAIATIGNQGLDRAFHALDGPDRDHLAAARADLNAAAATERRFDRSLLAIAFPSAIEATAKSVVRVNESRATLTSEAATSTSLQQLSRHEQILGAANDAVVQQVGILRTQLGLPPAETS